MPPKERKNRYKIRCLECNVEMDFDYKNKHNLKFHNDLLRQRKSIRYNVVGAPKNPFEAAVGKSLKLSKTGVCTEVPHTALQDDGIATCKLQPTIFTYLRYDTPYLVIYNYMIKVFSSPKTFFDEIHC